MPEVTLSSTSIGEESPLLSNSSLSSDDRAPSATPSDSSGTSSHCPASLISALSSGSGTSRDDSPAPPPSSDPEINVNLSPLGGATTSNRHESLKGRGLTHNNNNNNNKAWSCTAAHRQLVAVISGGGMAPNPQPAYLDRVVMEIIETERMYVRDLRMIVEDYLAHIIDHSEVSIRPEQVCALFGNIEDIYEFNSELLQALDLCERDPVAVAHCFVMKSEYFEIYTQYCTNYPNSVAALTECMRNKSLAKFFRERQASLKRPLPLGSYLLKPVQRILKYHLLLQEISKHFDLQDGAEVVEEAIYTMTGVAWYINDMKRKHEHAVRLQEVQSLLLNWKGADLTTYGELVLEGTFKVHRAKNERTLFLFERMLLISKRRGEHYVYKSHISCSTLMLIESSKDCLSFSVTHYKHPKQGHTVQAKNVEEKKLWAHHIKRIILENHHIIIPQRAKEAILEMDRFHPPRYRFSPDRLKKVLSCQKDNATRHLRPQLRPAESSSQPTNQRTESATVLPLQESDSEGDLLLVSSQQEDEQEEEEWRQQQAGGAGGEREEGGASRTRQDELSRSSMTPERRRTSIPTSNPETDMDSDPDPGIQHLRSEEDLDPAEELSLATPDLDSKTLSSADSSEEDQEEEEEKKEASGGSSLLPSSVLDKADAIAQHFSGSIKRGGEALDDVLSPGRASPRLPSRTGGLGLDGPTQLGSGSADLPETFGPADSILASPREDGPGEAGRGVRRRRDSILSKQDQLLISKIKTYYETAATKDASFSLQRRESLSHIPTGLVRTSVSRFDNKDQTNPRSTWARGSAEFDSDTGPSGRGAAELEEPEETRGTRSTQEDPCEDEEFRPSSEMIRIWQEMERQTTKSQRDTGGRHRCRDPQRPSGETGPPKLVPGVITEEAARSAPLSPKASDLIQTSTRTDTLNLFGAPVPRLVQLRAQADGGGLGPDRNWLDDGDTTKSKVLHLARQYSQRIRTSKAAERGWSQEVLIRTLDCVEEEEGSGKLSLVPPSLPQNQTTSLRLSPVDPVPGLPCRSRGLSPGQLRPHSPPSPVPAVEGFDWPDVRELRTKYAEREGGPRGPVGRSRSDPEQVCEGGLRRRSSCNSGLVLPDRVPGLQEKRTARLHRANSLDPRLSGAHVVQLQELQDQACTGSYQAVLPGRPEHQILVVEKLPEPDEAEGGRDPEDGFVQIRSPTSREKISIMAVIDRCRAYQESDEYRQRIDAGVTLEPAPVPVPVFPDPDQVQKAKTSGGMKQDGGQQSLVKNLKEKFQTLN